MNATSGGLAQNKVERRRTTEGGDQMQCWSSRGPSIPCTHFVTTTSTINIPRTRLFDKLSTFSLSIPLNNLNKHLPTARRPAKQVNLSLKLLHHSQSNPSRKHIQANPATSVTTKSFFSLHPTYHSIFGRIAFPILLPLSGADTNFSEHRVGAIYHRDCVVITLHCDGLIQNMSTRGS